jgi:hypothetical protein
VVSDSHISESVNLHFFVVVSMSREREFIVSQARHDDIIYEWSLEMVLAAVADCGSNECDGVIREMVERNVQDEICDLVAKFLGEQYTPCRNQISGSGGEVSPVMGLMQQRLGDAFYTHVLDGEVFAGPTPFRAEIVRLATYLWQGFLRVPGQSFGCLSQFVSID